MAPAFWAACLALAAIFPFAGNPAQAQQPSPVPQLTFKATDPNEKGDGTLSPAAREAIIHGPLPMSQADIDAKAAANKAADEALKARPQVAPPVRSWPRGALEGETERPDLSIPGGINIQGQSDPNVFPSDSTGAIGPFHFIQLINDKAGLYRANDRVLLASGTLNDLANNLASTKTDPQIIFDNRSGRFYYTMIEIFSAVDNRLAFGFSKGAAPTDLSGSWCHYEIGYATRFPDFPKLGDSPDFAIIGVKAFLPNITSNGGSTGLDLIGMRFAGADLIAIGKPPSGGTCPPASSFKIGAFFNLVDSDRNQVWTPVPAHQIYGIPSHPDAPPAGFVIARDGGSQPFHNLWFFAVVTDFTGNPIFGSSRRLTVDSYGIPPAAAQLSGQKLDAADARMTQAVQAFRPIRGRHSFWTQHTIKNPIDDRFSVVRIYEIDPLPILRGPFFSPILLGSLTISDSSSSLFNAAVSPDRQAIGATENFGNNWVVEYNRSGPTMFPTISAASALVEGPIQFTNVVESGGPYIDTESCPNSGDMCRWGDYSGASPDPNPRGLGVSGSGVVWGTNQFSSGATPPGTGPFRNWLTQIFALQP
jgi:hypothetical protein